MKGFPDHRLRLVAAALQLLLMVAVRAGYEFDFKTHFYFKHLIGSWTTEGELKGADGNVIKLKEEWKAGAAGENSFIIEGKRELNGNAQNYKWTITRDPATGRFEAALRSDDNNPDTLRFEINFSGEEMKMEMTALTGGGNSKIVLLDTFPEKDRDAFETKVTFTDEKDAVTLSGTLKNTRVK